MAASLPVRQPSASSRFIGVGAEPDLPHIGTVPSAVEANEVLGRIHGGHRVARRASVDVGFLDGGGGFGG